MSHYRYAVNAVAVLFAAVAFCWWLEQNFPALYLISAPPRYRWSASSSP